MKSFIAGGAVLAGLVLAIGGVQQAAQASSPDVFYGGLIWSSVGLVALGLGLLAFWLRYTR